MGRVAGVPSRVYVRAALLLLCQLSSPYNYEKMNKIPGGLTGPPPRPVLAYETLTALLRAAIRIELSKEARTLLRTPSG